MVTIVTIREREERALAERRKAMAIAEKRLAETAVEYGGHYRVFGSAANGAIHSRSDLDLLADFPEESASDAIRAAEKTCRELRLPCDVLDQANCKDEFLAFVLPGSRTLG